MSDKIKEWHELQYRMVEEGSEWKMMKIAKLATLEEQVEGMLDYGHDETRVRIVKITQEVVG